MQITTLTNDAIRRCLPNVLTEVEGETPLAEKLAPFISSAKVWLETEYLGPEDFLSAPHNNFAMSILVVKAVADALPSLDLVVTPTGMAVVSTDTMAPASKERVERLINALMERVRAAIPTLLDYCHTYEVWRKSERGRYFCATFIGLRDCAGLDISYEEARRRAILVESALADRYLGHAMLDTLREDYHSHAITRSNSLVNLIIATITNLISFKSFDRVFDPNRLWHAVCPIANEFKYHPIYKTIWEQEMADIFNAMGFKNNIKGGFYF